MENLKHSRKESRRFHATSLTRDVLTLPRLELLIGFCVKTSGMSLSVPMDALSSKSADKIYRVKQARM